MLVRNAFDTVRIDGGDPEPYVLSECQWSGRMQPSYVREMPLPVLDDAATIGCMVQLLRVLYRSPVLQVSPMLPGPGWICYVNDESDRLFQGATEAEALVVALEAYPGNS